MAKIGFSNVFVAKYGENEGAVSYSDGMKLGKAV